LGPAYFIIVSLITDENNTLKRVYRSKNSVVKSGQTHWKLELEMGLIEGGKYPLKFDIFAMNDTAEGIHVGYYQDNLQSILSATLRPINFKYDEKYAHIQELKADLHQIVKPPKPSLFDYLRGGMQINLAVAIDFTGSNGDPHNSNSLHYIGNSSRLNEYQRSISEIGVILESYDWDRSFPVWGFGEKGKVDFSIVRDSVKGVGGILEAYREKVRYVQLSGPTNMSGIIHRAIEMARETPVSDINQTYYVMLIMTDGEISDMDKTIKAIAEASTHPISIIIVGVGKADFTNMERLDGDKEKLPGVRDIVQFVPLREFSGNNRSALPNATLKELPKQVYKFMKYRAKVLQNNQHAPALRPLSEQRRNQLMQIRIQYAIQQDLVRRRNKEKLLVDRAIQREMQNFENEWAQKEIQAKLQWDQEEVNWMSSFFTPQRITYLNQLENETQEIRKEIENEWNKGKTEHTEKIEKSKHYKDRVYEAYQKKDSSRKKIKSAHLTIVSASGLPKMDLIGSIDPYIKITFGHFNSKTSVKKNTKHPVWNEDFTINDITTADVLELVLYDKDPDADDVVGHVSLHEELKEWIHHPGVEKTFNITARQGHKDKHAQGSIVIKIAFDIEKIVDPFDDEYWKNRVTERMEYRKNEIDISIVHWDNEKKREFSVNVRKQFDFDKQTAEDLLQKSVHAQYQYVPH